MRVGEAAAVATVARIARSWLRGLYNPYTTSGDIIVDGVHASVHSSWFLEGVLSTHRIAPTYQMLLGPLRLLQGGAALRGTVLRQLRERDAADERPGWPRDRRGHVPLAVALVAPRRHGHFFMQGALRGSWVADGGRRRCWPMRSHGWSCVHIFSGGLYKPPPFGHGSTKIPIAAIAATSGVEEVKSPTYKDLQKECRSAKKRRLLAPDFPCNGKKAVLQRSLSRKLSRKALMRRCMDAKREGRLPEGVGCGGTTADIGRALSKAEVEVFGMSKACYP